MLTLRLFQLSTLLLCVAVANGSEQKNVVLILADDLGWADTTLYGHSNLYETPNIERLAKRGMVFSNAYASPICSPTRASIMTGQNPARHGMTAPAAHLEVERFEAVASETGPPQQKSTNVRTSTRLKPELPMLSQVLQNAGYATAHFGKWHLGREPHSPLERGFDVDLPHWWGPGPKTGYLAPWSYNNPNFKEGSPGEHIEDRMAKEAAEWIRKRDRNKPFYMNYWQFSVHAPFGAKPELVERYRKKLGQQVDELADPEIRNQLLNSHVPNIGMPQQSPTYAAMVHSLDDAVGTLLDTLDAEGIEDDTIIIFYSDNGGNIHCGLEETSEAGRKYITPITSNHPLRGGKGGIHEGGVRVPAVVVWPGVTKPGALSETRIHATDLYPTILQMLSVDQPKSHTIDGVDFSKALQGEELQRPPLFTLVPNHGSTPHWLPPAISVHMDDWKLIRIFYYGENQDHQYRLYNLKQDLSETTNLASQNQDKVKSLDKLIENYLIQANVVVPQPNPSFDPKQFKPELIGVQPGGLKMPPGFKKEASDKSANQKKPVNFNTSLMGWQIRNGDAATKDQSIVITGANREPFIANAKIRSPEDTAIMIRIKAPMNGIAKVQWRLSGQETFPSNQQFQTVKITGGDWNELKVNLLNEEPIIHIRIHLPASQQGVEIDWIEIVSEKLEAANKRHWDFGTAAR